MDKNLSLIDDFVKSPSAALLFIATTKGTKNTKKNYYEGHKEKA